MRYGRLWNIWKYAIGVLVVQPLVDVFFRHGVLKEIDRRSHWESFVFVADLQLEYSFLLLEFIKQQRVPESDLRVSNFEPRRLLIDLKNFLGFVG